MVEGIKSLYRLQEDEDHTASLEKILNRYFHPKADLQKYEYLGHVDYDATAWIVTVNNQKYLLYAEDHIRDLSGAFESIKKNTGFEHGKFMKLSTPYESVKEPGFEECATSSGHDIVLLLKIEGKNVRN